MLGGRRPVRDVHGHEGHGDGGGVGEHVAGVGYEGKAARYDAAHDLGHHVGRDEHQSDDQAALAGTPHVVRVTVVAVPMAVMVMPRVDIVVVTFVRPMVVSGVSSGGDAYGMRIVVVPFVGAVVVTGVGIVVMLVMRPMVVTGLSIVVVLGMGAMVVTLVGVVLMLVMGVVVMLVMRPVVVTGVGIVVVLVMRPVVVALVASFGHSFHSLGSVSFCAAPVVAGMRLSLARRSTP